MNPVNNVNPASPLSGLNSPSSAQNRAETTDWFSMAESGPTDSITAASLFDVGTGIQDIATAVLSHICEPGNP